MTTRPCARVRNIPYYSNSALYFERIRQLACPIYLDSNTQSTHSDHSSISNKGGSSAARYDIVTAAPIEIVSTSATLLQQQGFAATQTPAACDAFFEQIKTAIAKHTSCGASHNAIPFVSGAIAVFSYDLGMQLAGLSSQSADQAWPDLFVGIYQWAIVQDHQTQQAWLVADPKQAEVKYQSLLEIVCPAAEQHNDKPNSAATNSFLLNSEWQHDIDRAEYNLQFQRAMQYIEQGDCYQVNLAQRMTTSYSGDPWLAYQRLRAKAPTPFAAYIELPDAVLISLSPERFIRVENKHVTTQPIKGTRRRGASRQEDAKLMAELSGSAKDRAENLMIVDLMRNDLGKSCLQGSIEVPALFQIESHPNVHHLVSTVTGELADAGVDAALELLKQALPGGSVTGAPKKRAMEIIDELEDFKRSIYCGSIAWINNDGNMDSNILIRSLLFLADRSGEDTSSGTVQCWGGGGIVADSTVEEEYCESLQKVRNLMDGLAGM